MSGLEYLKRNRHLTQEDIDFIYQYFFVLSGCRSAEILTTEYNSVSEFKHALVEELNSFKFIYDMQITDKSSFKNIYEAMLNVCAEYLVIEYYYQTGAGYEIEDTYDDKYYRNDRADYLDWALNLIFDIDEEDR